MANKDVPISSCQLKAITREGKWVVKPSWNEPDLITAPSYSQETDFITTEWRMECCTNEYLWKQILSKQFLSKVNNGVLIRG